jgi:hypothetical protein
MIRTTPRRDWAVGFKGNLKNSRGNDNNPTNAPTDKGYIRIYSNTDSFIAVKPDGSIRAWGNPCKGLIFFDCLDQPATKRLVYNWYGLCYYLRIRQNKHYQIFIPLKQVQVPIHP